LLKKLVFFSLPFGTLFLVVIRKGSLLPITVPSSEDQVSPLQHANAPLKQIANNVFKIQFKYS